MKVRGSKTIRCSIFLADRGRLSSGIDDIVLTAQAKALATKAVDLFANNFRDLAYLKHGSAEYADLGPDYLESCWGTTCLFTTWRLPLTGKL